MSFISEIRSYLFPKRRSHESDDKPVKNDDHDDLNARIPTPPSSPTPQSSESSKSKRFTKIELKEADKIAQEKFLETLRAIGRRLQGVDTPQK